MKEKGFTLIEILAVIVIISITTLLIITSVEKRIKEAKNILSSSQLETIENAVYVYAINYASEIPDLEIKGVDTVTLATLIDKGLIETSDITINGDVLPTTNTAIIAYVNGSLKAKYDESQTGSNIIFLVGASSISISKNSTYTDMGAYVVIPETGIVELTSSNMSSNVNTGTSGTYQVTYTYSNSTSVTRTVRVL
jgi:prepilin-type N-terminal cleavage/methylation domain-containing protein